MKTSPIVKALLFLSIFIVPSLLAAQQLYLEPFLGRNTTNFDGQAYGSNPQNNFVYGARIAAGADHLQVGAEYHRYLSKPKWDISSPATGDKIGQHEFQTVYYGAFLRTKIAKYPALRFGLKLQAGAGYYNTERISDVPGEPAVVKFDQKIGFNGGLGFSIPTTDWVMIELGYAYHYVEYDKTSSANGFNGSYHSIQAGLSLNLVFGKRARQYNDIRKG